MAGHPNEDHRLLMETDLLSAELTQSQFRQISQLLYELCGIQLSDGKEGLVKARLMKRLRTLGLSSFDAYLKYVEQDSTYQELTTMVDSLTTNKTSFFRENQHFDFLREQILPPYQIKGSRMRIWSAGCASGEEPYSIAILLREEWPGVEHKDVRILATDLSTKVLALAREGVYDEQSVRDMPPPLVNRYLTCNGQGLSRQYRVKDELRGMIRFAQLNLMEEWPMKGPFDVIFCRNVMIYFDKPTQQALVRRFWQILAPGGYLLIGHSESLTHSSREFAYVQPATYRK